MSKKDAQNGKEFGSTFDTLLKNRNFICYLGVVTGEEDKIEKQALMISKQEENFSHK